MSVLSKVFNVIFDTPEKKQQRACFEQATQAVCSNNNQALTTALTGAAFDQEKNQYLLVETIARDNLEGFEAILDAANISVSQKLSMYTGSGMTTEMLDTPMLPYAIGRGSEKIARFLASHPDTDPQASGTVTLFNAFACGPMGGGFVHESKVPQPNPQQLASGVGMAEVAGIINKRIDAAKTPKCQ